MPIVIPKKPKPPTPVPLVKEVKENPVSVVAPVNVTVDTSEIANALSEQAKRMQKTVELLAGAVEKLEAGKSFTVTVTDWTTNGRIKSLTITKT